MSRERLIDQQWTAVLKDDGALGAEIRAKGTAWSGDWTGGTYTVFDCDTEPTIPQIRLAALAPRMARALLDIERRSRLACYCPECGSWISGKRSHEEKCMLGAICGEILALNDAEAAREDETRG
jgi:hypothetical protein